MDDAHHRDDLSTATEIVLMAGALSLIAILLLLIVAAL